jgi:hypothetical protein
MTQTAAISAIRTMTHEVGLDLTGDDEALLSRREDDPLSEADTARLATISQSLSRGFYFLAARGHTFADPAGIPNRFGSTLEANYPEASPSFLKFAYSYWTLRLIIDHRAFENNRPIAWNLLAGYDDQVLRPLFFPTPGPVIIPPDRRATTQRRLIAGSGAPINIDDFLRGNPILLRDRKREASTPGAGCTSVIAVILSVTLGIVLL